MICSNDSSFNLAQKWTPPVFIASYWIWFLTLVCRAGRGWECGQKRKLNSVKHLSWKLESIFIHPSSSAWSVVGLRGQQPKPKPKPRPPSPQPQSIFSKDMKEKQHNLTFTTSYLRDYSFTWLTSSPWLIFSLLWPLYSLIYIKHAPDKYLLCIQIFIQSHKSCTEIICMSLDFLT